MSRATALNYPAHGSRAILMLCYCRQGEIPLALAYISSSVQFRGKFRGIVASVARSLSIQIRLSPTVFVFMSLVRPRVFPGANELTTLRHSTIGGCAYSHFVSRRAHLGMYLPSEIKRTSDFVC